jgi:hypothetical protein
LSQNVFDALAGNDDFLSPLAAERGLDKNSATLRDLIRLPPELVRDSFRRTVGSQAVAKADAQFTMIQRILSARGLYFGMLDDALERYERRWDGVEFRRLADPRLGIGAIAKRFEEFGIFTTGQLLKAIPQGRPASSFLVLTEKVADKLEDRLALLRAEMIAENEHFEPVLSRAGLASLSDELRAFAALHGIATIGDLSGHSENELLRKKVMTLRLAHELHELSLRYEIRWAPSCRGFFEPVAR